MDTTGMAGQAVFSLAEAAAGRRLRVSSLAGGQAVRSRLYALGLGPGTPVTVAAAGGGPVVVEVRGGRLLLGRGMAEQVMVCAV